MKKIASLILIALIGALCASARAKAGQKVGVEFETMTYEFGNISENDAPVTHVFSFTNTGTTPVAILWAKSSCGCTQPEYDRKPVLPGQKATVKVTFNPKGQAGEVNKDIRLRMTNGNKKSEEIVLRLKGAVVPKGKK